MKKSIWHASDESGRLKRFMHIYIRWWSTSDDRKMIFMWNNNYMESREEKITHKFHIMRASARPAIIWSTYKTRDYLKEVEKRRASSQSNYYIIYLFIKLNHCKLKTLNIVYRFARQLLFPSFFSIIPSFIRFHSLTITLYSFFLFCCCCLFGFFWLSIRLKSGAMVMWSYYYVTVAAMNCTFRRIVIDEKRWLIVCCWFFVARPSSKNLIE